MKRCNIDGFIIGCFALLVGLFFHQVLFYDKLPIPSDTLVGLYHPWRDLYAATNPHGLPFKNFLITDPIRQQIPWRKIVIDYWKIGQLPGWNPYVFSGTPLAANVQSAAFYPFNVLFLLFNFTTAWSILIISQPFLSGLWLYLYLRHLKLSSLASLFGAIIWGFSGFNIAWLTWGTIGQTIVWLPLILLAVDKLIEKPVVIWWLVLIVNLTLSFLAGHLQTSFYIIILASVYAAWRLHQSIQPRVKAFWLLVAAASFVGLTVLQWLPFLKFFLQSGRVQEFNNWLKDGWFLPWQHLIQFIAPDFFGNPTTLNYWGQWNYGEFIGYFGLSSLFLAIYALFYLGSTLIRFWGLVAGVILLFMLPTPLAKIIYQWKIPYLATLQPTRLMGLLDFSLILLASFGFDYWSKEKKLQIGKLILSGGIFILLLWLFVIVVKGLTENSEFRANLLVSQRNLYLPTLLYLGFAVAVWSSIFVKKQIFLFSIIVLTIFDLYRFGWKFTPFVSRNYFFPETASISYLRNENKPFRVMSLDNKILPPNVGAYYNIESIEGYDPLYSSRYEEFIAALNHNRPEISGPFGFNRIITVTNLDSTLLPLLNVQYILTLAEIKKPYLIKKFQEGETRIYQDQRALPRAFLVAGVEVINDKQSILSRLYDQKFNPRETAIIETGTSLDSAPLLPEESVSLDHYTSQALRLTVRTRRDRLLVIGNIWDDGWKAKLDGTPISVLRTNYLFQGIIVPSGQHMVDLAYELFR